LEGADRAIGDGGRAVHALPPECHPKKCNAISDALANAHRDWQAGRGP
jgi:hypothetical protein